VGKIILDRNCACYMTVFLLMRGCSMLHCIQIYVDLVVQRSAQTRRLLLGCPANVIATGTELRQPHTPALAGTRKQGFQETKTKQVEPIPAYLTPIRTDTYNSQEGVTELHFG